MDPRPENTRISGACGNQGASGDWRNVGSGRSFWSPRVAGAARGSVPAGRFRPGRLFLAFGFLVLLITGIQAQVSPPQAVEPVPSENQMCWQEMEYYAFVHFSLNTYTNQAWGYGNEDIKLFNPEKLDCRQWARICKEAGMKGIIITAKHHCGFCLWPSKYTDYSVKNAPWKNGKGDVVREMADACKEYGLKLGIYLSPWDRNSPLYGKPEYITYFRNQLTELLSNYGPIFEVWFDGANGGSGWYGGANETRKIDAETYYQWQETYRLIRRLQPECVIWNDGGDRGDLRWVGTEAGFVGETNWSFLNQEGMVDWGMLQYGLEQGDSWVAAEVNTSIRPEWFYHPEEDSKVKSATDLLDLWYQSVGRNASLLLNFPIMPNGLIHPADEEAALDLAAQVKKAFAVNLTERARASASAVRGTQTGDGGPALRGTGNEGSPFGADKAIDGKPDTYWTMDDGECSGDLTVTLDKPALVNRIMIQEYIRLGQRVKSFEVQALVAGNWTRLASGTTVGYKRLLRFPSVETTAIKLRILDARDCPLISNVRIYSAPSLLVPPVITRTQAGEILLSSSDPGPEFHYTLDGSTPDGKSALYAGPVACPGKVRVRAVAIDPVNGQTSSEASESFDIPRRDWKILDTTDRNALAILDGDLKTAWHLSLPGSGKRPRLPVDLVIDLGGEYTLSGFRYAPDLARWGAGIITNYQFLVSTDNKTWTLADQGEFANIQNNPVRQTKTFAAQKGRYIKLRALKNAQSDGNMGYGEIDVLTQ